MHIDEKSRKWIANLNDKENYVLHISNLTEYSKMGFVLKNIHRVMKCKQSRWLKPFIDLDSKLRADAQDDFEKDYINSWVVQYLVKQWWTHMEYELVVNKKEHQIFHHHHIIKTIIYTMKAWLVITKTKGWSN